jgi:cellulose synthase/poly-beta-1,6-N-acetylglucosamine synthase-like glycosyltransferase
VRYFSRDSSHGKPSALNYALGFARGEIVGVFDADNVPQPDFLLRTAKYFSDESLVAVQGLLSSLNAEENTLTKLIHYEGILHFNALFSGKDKLSLFVPFAGTCLFVKRKVLEEVGGWQNRALSEDLELSARLTEKGYGVKFAPDVKSWQENPSRFKQLIRQRLRWFRGCLEVSLKYGRLTKRLNRKSLDAEVFFLGPFIMLLVALTYVFGLFTIFQPYHFGMFTKLLIQSLSFMSLLTLLIVGVGLAYSSKPRKVSNVLWVPFLYLYWSAQVFIASYVFLQIIFRRPREWKKTAHTGTITSKEFH